jgi:hypothetical protein
MVGCRGPDRWSDADGVFVVDLVNVHWHGA